MDKLAKPSGITYQQHRANVVEQAELILDAWPFLEKKYERFFKEPLRPILVEAAEWHDEGKLYPPWQIPCQKDYQQYRQWRITKGYDVEEVNRHQYKAFEQQMRQEKKMTGANLFKSGVRHEFASLLYAEEKGKILAPVVKAAIAAHHGKLSGFHERRWKHDRAKDKISIGPFYKYWEDFVTLEDTGCDLPTNKERLFKRLKFSTIRTLLQLADTRASRMESEGKGALVKLLPFTLKDRFDNLRPVQEAAESIAQSKEWQAILRAPTGSGKTYASLLWAEGQVNLDRADRLIIAMPTRFTSNALAESAGKQMGATGLYHSSAWHNQFGDEKDKQKINEARELHRMARLMATPVNVCTIDHLLICLTGTKEQHHHTFYFLANSAVVFDEADFYDPFIQANIVVLLDVLKILEVPVLIMSATVPNSALKLYNIKYPIKSPESNPQEDFQPKKTLQWIGKAETPADVSDYLEKMVASGNGIIYANTIARALQYYNWFKAKLEENPSIPLVIYHSRFTEPDKKRIESELLDMLGEAAWDNYEADNTPVKGIAILTQIGEMSVNISSQLMVSEVCPWDRLAQRIGRLVRFKSKKAISGTCYVVEPQKKGSFYPAPYGEYIREINGWNAYPAMAKTEEDIQANYQDGQIVTPDLLVEKVNGLYQEPPKIKGSIKKNQRNLLKLIKKNWLIPKRVRVEEDDSCVSGENEWSSRQIPQQQTVFTDIESIHPSFKNFQEYQEFALIQGVSIYQYQLEKAMRAEKDMIKIGSAERNIGEKGETITIYYTSAYKSKTGLAFLYE